MSFLSNFDITVIDPGFLVELSTRRRAELVADLQERARPGGVHVILPTCKSLTPEALRPLYQDWLQEEELKRRRRAGSKGAPGLVFSKPVCPPDTP